MSDLKDEKPEDKKPEPKAPKAAKPAFKQYKTSRPINIEFDILVRGENIMGHKGEEKGHVYFDVPTELAELFEKHYHVQCGNVVPL